VGEELFLCGDKSLHPLFGYTHKKGNNLMRKLLKENAK
jgi:hypothetical protein